MRSTLSTLFLFALLLLNACNTEDDNPINNSPIDNNPSESKYLFDFSSDTEGWVGEFADYPANTWADIDKTKTAEEFYELDFGFSQLPEPLDQTKGSLMQTGNNHSDDLFMFVKKKITGLDPNKEYEATIKVEFATNIADGLFGVGGAPGESVYLKAGFASIEPKICLDGSENHFRMNIDKGNQAIGGSDMQVIGNFANGSDKCIYTLKSLKMDSPLLVKANENGEIWAIIGTDSGFEATTTIYYNSIDIDLKKK